MSELLRVAGVLLFGGVAVGCLVYAWDLWRGDHQQYEANRRKLKAGHPLTDDDIRKVFRRPYRSPWHYWNSL